MGNKQINRFITHVAIKRLTNENLLWLLVQWVLNTDWCRPPAVWSWPPTGMSAWAPAAERRGRPLSVLVLDKHKPLAARGCLICASCVTFCAKEVAKWSVLGCWMCFCACEYRPLDWGSSRGPQQEAPAGDTVFIVKHQVCLTEL